MTTKFVVLCQNLEPEFTLFFTFSKLDGPEISGKELT